MVKVKICGITNKHDALAASALGADALGFVFAESPRRIDPEAVRDVIKELPPFVMTVGVFVNETGEKVRNIRDYCGLDFVQLHGDEDENYVASMGRRVIKTLKVKDGVIPSTDGYANATLLLDAYSPVRAGGTGETFNWKLAGKPASERPIILAGGLNPDNVKEAVETIKPYAVDVSSGVEKEYGRKDYAKLARFIHRAKLSS